MFEQFIDQSGPSLGSMMVHVMTFTDEGDLDMVKPLWGLQNHQGPNWMYGQAKTQSKQDFAVSFFKFVVFCVELMGYKWVDLSDI